MHTDEIAWDKNQVPIHVLKAPCNHYAASSGLSKAAEDSSISTAMRILKEKRISY